MTDPTEQRPAREGRRPRLLYVVSEDWFFLLHRLPMARAARAAGFDVHVACRVVSGAPDIAAENFTLHPVAFLRGRISPLASLATIRALRRTLGAVKPDIVHHIALQPCVLGSLAVLGQPVACVNTITGLGYAFTSRSMKARALRVVLTIAVRWLLNRRRSTTTVENPDDGNLLTKLGLAPDKIVLISGSGVDVKRFTPQPEPEGPVTIGFAARLVANKGIRTLIAAHRALRAKGLPTHLLIAGTADRANPASISEREIETWRNEPGIDMLGQVDDIADLWARAQIGVLPSLGGEGLPVALLEAAACGRPLVATDVPGCREITIPGQTGLLVPPGDAGALASALETLAGDQAMRQRLGAAARALAVARFSAEAVGQQIVAVYRRLAPGIAGMHPPIGSV